MYTLNFDISKKYDGFKIMNAVNNGPIHKRHANDQSRSNLEDYKAAGIPYARNHDASFCSSYGSEHTVDISAIFPDFSKEKASYIRSLIKHGNKCFIDNIDKSKITHFYIWNNW